MSHSPIRLLLVEDNPADAVLLKHLLAETREESFHVGHVESIAEAASCLERDSFDAILLDLSLPDSHGIDTVAQTNAVAPRLPIVVMTGLDDEATAVEAVRQGAQDFLIKGHSDGRLLARAIRYAMERKRAEQQLKALNETLEQRVAERTAVATRRAAQLQVLASELTRTEHRERRRLAQILHDHLQQLLYAARLSLGALRRGDQQQSMEETIGRVDDLLNQSLEVSRSLTVELSPPVLYEAGLAAALEWLGRHMQETCGLAVGVQADSRADPESEDLCILLFEAVRELLFNVMKHAHTGSAQVQMTAAPRGQVRLVVSDDGSGLNPVALKEEPATTSGGFGLFSIRERLKLLGGHLQVEGAPGQGTRVTISAPRRLDSPPAAPRPAAQPSDGRAEAPSNHPPRGRRIRVLLADDQHILREGLVRLLHEHADIEVVGQAADGQTAVDLAFQKRPDVAVIDVSMPDLNGIEVTRRLTAGLPGIRVIGLSVHDEEEVALAMRAAGAAAYLTKGGSPAALVAAIRGHPHPSHEDHCHGSRKQSQEPVQKKPRPVGR